MFNTDELAGYIKLHLKDEPEGVKSRLTDLPLQDVAEALNRLTTAEAAEVLALLPAPRAVAVCNQSLLRRRGTVLEQLEPALAAQLLGGVASDQRADILRSISPHERHRLLPLLPPDLRSEAERLLQYPDDTAGGFMTTEFVRLEPHLTAGQALACIRAAARDHEHVYACYVLEPSTGALLGAVSLRDLVMADESRPVADVMDSRPVTAEALENRESVARKIGKYNLLALPVLERDGRVVGSVTVDDVIDVMNEEQTEDALRQGAVEPGALDRPYLDMPFWAMVRKRGGWLVVLFLGEMLTATAMGYFEDVMARAVVLALFVPLIISSGGNSGSQGTTIVIRAMALQEVRLRDWWRIMRREVYSGLALGSVLGSIGFLRIALWSAFTPIYGPHWHLIALTVALSLVGVVMWGTLSGSMLPLLLRRAGLDPAASSAPFVATLVDVTGLVIYFSVAVAVLRGTLL